MNEIEVFSTKFIEAAIAEKDRFDVMLAVSDDVEFDEEQLKDYEKTFVELLLLPKEEIVQMLNNFKEMLAVRINKQDTDITSSLIGEWNIMQSGMAQD
jgi:hypothetical protein